ncbi:MAG: flagellar hook-associated protein FlgL [Desulforhopalus sp.]
MKVTENSTYRLMQTNLDRITNDLLVLRNQGATGLKLNKPSDDPGAIRPVLTTRTQLQQNARYLETLGQANDKMAATDGHLAQVENVLVRVKEIAINSVNSALSESDMATLADEIAELKNELLDSANAVVNGKYIFAGYQENTKPFTANPAYDPDSYDPGDINTWPYFYNGDNNPTQLEITPGEVIETNLTGNEVFFGITNEIAATGYSNPYQGESMTSGPLVPGPYADNIILTDGLTPPGSTYTIPGSSLEALAGETNYAGKVAGLFSASGTGLTSTANSATVDLGPLSLTGFDEIEGDVYNLDITSGGTVVSVQLDGPSGYDYTLDGMASALANTVPTPTNLTATGGTLANGVSYDISGGSLVLTGPTDGSEILLSESITDLGVVGASGGISGGDQTVYGTFTVAPNSPTDVKIEGANLGAVGLTADTLNGSSGRIDLFTILTRAEEAIRSGNVDDINGAGGSIQAQIENLEIAANQNRKQRSTLGARAQRVDSAIVHQEDARIDLKQILSRYQDADIIQIFNDITQKETAFQAALNVTSRVSQISILDYF